ncbi:MAG TPA: hypothetical protein VF121_16240 [Thermoanaerobaculia bacterium]|nr:hypothetical protein [Thermoanaerobaculia bacterium]
MPTRPRPLVRLLNSTLAGLLLLLALASPASGKAGQAGCCLADDTCFDGIRETECKAKPKFRGFTDCEVCNDEKTDCEEDTSGDVTVFICFLKSGAPRTPTITCETDDKCLLNQGDTCKPFTTKKPANLLADDTCVCCDATNPTCFLKAVHPGPPKKIEIQVQDEESGLLFVDVALAENAGVAIPSFEIGTTGPLIVTATKVNQALASRVELQVMDRAVNTIRCDPILTEVVRATGRPTVQTFSGLAKEEDTVEIQNGTPGLRHLEVLVNGVKFHAGGLKDGETRTLDVSAALLPANNLFTLRGTGKPGGSAAVLISEGSP